jgi:hypothetical protein
MITEYELHIDERQHQKRCFMLGGLVCTSTRAAILDSQLSRVRARVNLTKEMRWTKVSNTYLDAYKAWADVQISSIYYV